MGVGFGDGEDRARGVGEDGAAADAFQIEGCGDDAAARGERSVGGRVGALDPDVRAPGGLVAANEAGDVAAAQRADEVLAAVLGIPAEQLGTPCS